MLTRSLAGWRDQYERMKRTYARLPGHTSSVDYDDNLVHFFQDCWHLKDWILSDTNVSDAVKGRVEDQVKVHRSLEISAALANGWKHLGRPRPGRPQARRRGSLKKPVDAEVTSKSVTVSLQTGRADISHTVTLDDGSVLSLQDVARDALNDWDDVLRQLGLNP